MHRHVYSGRKLSRTSAQRQALIKGLATSLIVEEQITTTKPKAKEVIPYFERVVTKAKRGGLHSRRQVLAAISTETAVRKLYEELVPRFGERSSGFVSLKPAGWRRGDNAELATLSLTAQPGKKPATPKPAKAASSAQPVNKQEVKS